MIPNHILKFAFNQPEKLLQAVQHSDRFMDCELALQILNIEPKCSKFIQVNPHDVYYKQIRHDKNIHYAQLLNKYFEIPKAYFRDELFHVLDDNFFYCQLEFIEKLPKSIQIDLFKCAAFNGQLKVVNIFKQLLKPDDIPNTNRPLQHAIRSCAHECVQALMEYQTNTKLNYESTELIEATRTQTDISQFLHQAKLKDYNGKTALMYAVEVQSYELVRILVQYECQQRDRKGETALMKAVDQKFYPAIDLLKDEMGCADNKGECALSLALDMPAPTWVIQKLFEKEHRLISISNYQEDFALQFKQRRDMFNSSLELKMVAIGKYKYSAHVDYFQKRAEHMLALGGKLMMPKTTMNIVMTKTGIGKKKMTNIEELSNQWVEDNKCNYLLILEETKNILQNMKTTKTLRSETMLSLIYLFQVIFRKLLLKYFVKLLQQFMTCYTKKQK
ncbi:Ankyrin_repeats-containing protein [Hexamita inflata]|uniref:Ankyrin repeats-containing protein n=1 Tax=Hexamita inflata TaxID=28002 RepID=A0AA86QQU1_9EUKA|nr:Ankyrin repeats-containing protein [Hexamita inflata]